MGDSEAEALVNQCFQRSIEVPAQFFEANADEVSRVCHAMAQRFHRGGRLIAFGNGAFATDAQHVSVEFVHPVVMGKRALPALALTNDSALLSGMAVGNVGGMPFVRQLKVLARKDDMAMGFSADGNCANVVEALSAARQMGVLTIGMTGGDGGMMAKAELDACFVVPSDEPHLIQESHETLYHILWELVHIFFEHEGLLR